MASRGQQKILCWVLVVVTILVLDKLALGDIDLSPFRCSDARNCGEPLFLTRLMKKSNVLEAQQAAMVEFPNASAFQQVRHIQSYSGFFTVNETTDSNIFFWYFPAETEPEESPLLLWLQGGPGAPSTLDVFSQSGPLQIGDDLQLTLGADRWTKMMNVLYFDSPVGVGFSFTKNTSGYPTSQEEYTRDLYAALSQFFQLFPDHRTNDFFIAGISYAGKYVPALAYEIHKKNPTASTKINLRGIAIGNGFVDPSIQSGYSKFLYGISLIDLQTKLQFERIEDEIKSLILNEEYKAASDKLMNSYLFTANGTKSIIVNVTGVSNTDYLTSYEHAEEEYDEFSKKLAKIIVMPELRKIIHVGNQDYWALCMNYITHYLHDDIVQSVAPKLEVLMDNYRVVLYSGQLDIICNYRLMVDYVRELKWEGAEDYRNAERHQWHVAGELAGYAKSAGNFTEILVRKVGHAANIDRSSWIFDLLKRFSHDIPFF